MKKLSSGFTIVELLVVIVVIGVLAAITVVSYTGVNNKAIAASLQTDLKNAVTKLKMYNIDNGKYPASMATSNGLFCPSPADAKYCLKASDGNTYTSYSTNSPSNTTFSLFVVNTNGMRYRVTDNTSPIAFVLPANTVDNGDGTYTTTIYADSSDGSIGVNGSGTSPACPAYQVIANQALIGPDSSSDCYDSDLDAYFSMSFNYFVKFRLDLIPGNVNSANLFVYKTIYWVTSNTDPRKVASIPDFGTLDSSDYNTAAYISNIGNIFIPTNAAGYYNLSVTSAVNSDKTNGRSYSSFKIYPNSPVVQSIINSSTAANKPYLSVTWSL